MKTKDLSDFEHAVIWAKNLLLSKNFCVLDSETTGLGSKDEICQIALIDSSGEKLIDSLVRPTVEISEEATAIHGITNEDVANSPTFEELLLPILKAVGRKDLVIYNAEFDLRLIRQSVKPYGFQLALPSNGRRAHRIFLNGGSIHCAMEQYSQWVGEWRNSHGNYKWQPLPGGDHTALGDCKATLKVIEEMSSGRME